MYCPHCGVQNARETRYCRGCGEDLRLVSQAVTKSLPLVIAQRVDEAIDRGRGGWRSYQLFRAEHRKVFAQVLMSLSALFMVVWTFMLGRGNASFAGGFLLVMTSALLLSSLHELWLRHKRGQQMLERNDLSTSNTTKELLNAQELPVDQLGKAPASITEPTTRRLKVERKNTE